MFKMSGWFRVVHWSGCVPQCPPPLPARQKNYLLTRINANLTFNPSEGKTNLTPSPHRQHPIPVLPAPVPVACAAVGAPAAAASQQWTVPHGQWPPEAFAAMQETAPRMGIEI